MTMRSVLVHTGVIVFAAMVGAVASYFLWPYRKAEGGDVATSEQRQALFDMLSPVPLSNCRLERFGEARDGGYLMCGNLMEGVRAGYSYGISGYDQWGCDISTKRGIPIHQYDCFDQRQPECPGGTMVFHPECVAERAKAEDGRAFDNIASHIAVNGDVSKRLIMKMDVEGAEWKSLLTVPDDVLTRIDQLTVEFHWIENAISVAVVRRLKRFFEVAHLHINNASCSRGVEPFPGWAYEVLFVNKRLAIVDPSGQVSLPNPLDKPNIPLLPDCPP